MKIGQRDNRIKGMRVKHSEVGVLGKEIGGGGGGSGRGSGVSLSRQRNIE